MDGYWRGGGSTLLQRLKSHSACSGSSGLSSGQHPPDSADAHRPTVDEQHRSHLRSTLFPGYTLRTRRFLGIWIDVNLPVGIGAVTSWYDTIGPGFKRGSFRERAARCPTAGTFGIAAVLGRTFTGRGTWFSLVSRFVTKPDCEARGRGARQCRARLRAWAGVAASQRPRRCAAFWRNAAGRRGGG
jgi:hypothetical protein